MADVVPVVLKFQICSKVFGINIIQYHLAGSCLGEVPLEAASEIHGTKKDDVSVNDKLVALGGDQPHFLI
jgi:hypothetical protein